MFVGVRKIRPNIHVLEHSCEPYSAEAKFLDVALTHWNQSVDTSYSITYGNDPY